MAGTLFVVATPIGNLEDISMRALRVLREAALIAAEDTRRTGQLLARYAIRTPTTSLHEHNEHRKSRAIVDRLMGGDCVALVTDAGTPGISDPGRALVRAAGEAGVRVEPIPGPNAAIALLSVSGFDTDRFSFLGFPPIRSKDRANWLRAVAASSGTIVFYEAPHRIRRTLEEIRAEVGDLTAIVGRELTKAHEQLVKGPISQVLGEALLERGEFTVAMEMNREGHATGKIHGKPLSDAALWQEFGDITENAETTRYEAVRLLAERYGLPRNAVKAALERGKKLVE
ncbi:MAG: 16S rRNA (cytidine(1402)-2'-O)-methyltransferase [Acidobacteria bacterium]|nr:16S rRNA (cytidine(1402)-2'-O)-methyltransferase [Acidobacteriota bacterium]